MNLIGHYTCAAMPAPEVRVGAVLPDLVALYRRKVRPLVLARTWGEREAEWPAGMGPLLAGVAFHQTVDVHFHRAPVFRTSAEAIQSALLGASRTPGLKRFLPAHVLTELFLDHLLLQRDPDLAEAFYRDLADAAALMETFVARHPLADRTAFRAFLDHIVNGRFVDAYASPGGLLRRMERILLHMGQRALEPAEQEAVVAYWQGAAEETLARLDRFVQAMRLLVPQPAQVSAAARQAPADRPWDAPPARLQPA